MPTLDYNTAIKGIRDANDDFIQLLSKLRNILTTSDELKFVLGNDEIVIDGLLALIDNYRNGRFQSVTIGTAPECVVLSIDDGSLKVTDLGGNLVGVVCSGLSFSDIVDTTIDTATLKNCNVESINGSVKVSGGTVSMESIKVGTFETQSLVAHKYVSGYAATMETSYTRNLYIQGDRRMKFPVKRDVFSDGGVPVDDFFSKISPNYSGGVWTWNDDDAVTPAVLGLQPRNVVGVIPDLITICGNNRYADFYTMLGPANLKNLRADVYSIANITPFSMTSDYFYMASAILWPFTTYENYAGYTYETKDLVVFEFRTEDIGKEVYYRTSESPWTIYRTLKVNYNNLAPISAEFSTTYTIPAYSCVKFIVNKTGSAQEGATLSILEIA